MKIRNKILIAFGVFLFLFVLMYATIESKTKDYYNYSGYVVDIVREGNDTVFVTVKR